MELLELIRNRRSIRTYNPDMEVEQAKLDYIMECARFAPSAVNFQPWSFHVIKGNAKKQFDDAYARDWFKNAPVCIVVCCDHNVSWHRDAYDGKDHADIDAAIVADHIILAATEQGLGSCWVCNFDPDFVKGFLSLPDNVEPEVVIPIGYGTLEGSRDKVRKSLNETMTTLR